MNWAVRVTTAALLSLLLGVHWGVLQSLAWATMLIERAQNQPLSLAIQSTFDGHHPCQICLFVRHGKNADKHHEAPRVTTPKLDSFARLEVLPILSAPEVPPLNFGPLASLTSWTEPPALPPPRLS